MTFTGFSHLSIPRRACSRGQFGSGSAMVRENSSKLIQPWYPRPSGSVMAFNTLMMGQVS
jgi:hypothetical protein